MPSSFLAPKRPFPSVVPDWERAKPPTSEDWRTLEPCQKGPGRKIRAFPKEFVKSCGPRASREKNDLPQRKNILPATHCAGPSAGWTEGRRTGRDWRLTLSDLFSIFCRNRNESDATDEEVCAALGRDGDPVGDQSHGRPSARALIHLAQAAACGGNRGDTVRGSLE